MSEVKFYYKGKYLGSCDSDYMDCDGLYDLIVTDDIAASEILNYLNSLGDPVFPVSDEDWNTPETNIDNVDRTDLYNTLMKELGYQYDDWGEVYIDDGDFEIFTDDVELEGCGRKKKSKKKVLNQKCGSKEGCSSRKKSVRESNHTDLVSKIVSVMSNYEYGYDPDMSDIDAMLQELTKMGVHVDTSAAFEKAWVAAHNKVERATWGKSGDAMHYDMFLPREIEAIEDYDSDYWEYIYKNHPNGFDIKPKIESVNSIPGLDIDMWYGDEFEPMKYGADAYYGPDGYHGWIYSDSGKKIGDYTADDSLVVSDNFMVDWEE